MICFDSGNGGNAAMMPSLLWRVSIFHPNRECDGQTKITVRHVGW